MKLSNLIFIPILSVMIGCGSSTVEEIYLSENSIDKKVQNNKQDISMYLGKSVDLDYGLDKDMKNFQWYDDGTLISSDRALVYAPSYIGKHEIRLLTIDQYGDKEELYIYIDVKDPKIEQTKDLDPKNTKPNKLKKEKIIKPSKKLSGVHINEVLPSNIDSAYDRDYYAFSDYIELKNYENKDVDLSGYTLSDDKKSWKFPKNTKIKANDYLLVWADKKDKSKKELHTNFKLSQKKDSVIFKDNSGNIIDHINFKKIKSGVSINEINGKIVYMNPTPNGKNGTMISSQVSSDKPNHSLNSGFYNGSKLISLSSNDNSTIYYTTDGKTPTKNSKIYTKPIVINKSTVVKSRSYSNGLLDSEVATNSYILDFETTLPVVSVSVDNKFLYDDMIGIYADGKNGAFLKCDEVNGYFNYAQPWERSSRIEYFESDGTKSFDIGVGISISGECSRKFQKKSFAFEMDSKYGLKKLNYKLYPQKDISKFKDFKLRVDAKISDILTADLIESGKLNVDYQAYQPVHMFVNGEYWGQYDVREKKGKDYLESNYPKIDTKKIDIISAAKVKRGDDKEYNKLSNIVSRQDLSIQSNYNIVSNMIDMNNYIDYMSLMIYAGTKDWLDNNTRLWREKKPNAKWRWMQDDVDDGFVWNTNQNNFIKIKNKSKYLTAKLFIALSKNSKFKIMFKNRFNELLQTTFSPENVLSHMNNIIDIKRSEMKKEKYGNKIVTKITTLDRYLNRYDEYFNDTKDFAVKRAAIVKKQLDNF